MTANTWLEPLSIGFVIAFTAGCGSPMDLGGGEEVGQVGIRLSSVPSDGTCIRFTTTAGMRSIQQSFDGVADTPLTAALHGLPYNQTLSIFAEAFGGTCSALNMASLATYLSDAQTTILAPGETKSLGFTLRPTGNVNGTADFQFVTMLPTSKNFGNVVIGQQSAPTSFTITNIGMVPTSPLTTSLVEPGGATGQFTMSSTCSGPLPAGQTCSVQVTFAPTSAFSKSATLQVAAMTGGTLSAGLLGVGLVPAHLTISVATANLGNVPLGSLRPAEFIITNTGDEPTGAATTTLDPPSGEFFLSGCSGVIAGHQACRPAVFLIPQTIGPKSETLTVTTSPGGTVSATISANAVSPLTISPSPADFGSAPVGSRGVTQTLTVKNTSSQPSTALTISSATPDFTITADACSTKVLATNATCTVTVQLSPTTAGPLTGALNASTTTAGWTAQAPLTGSGT